MGQLMSQALGSVVVRGWRPTQDRSGRGRGGLMMKGGMMMMMMTGARR